VYRIGIINQHRMTEGLIEQVVRFRIGLWDYYSQRGYPPAELSEIIICPRGSKRILFGTLQRMPCLLSFAPEQAKHGRPITRIRAGKPLFAEFEIAADGQVARQYWARPLWWKAIWQPRVDYPRLRFRPPLCPEKAKDKRLKIDKQSRGRVLFRI